MVVVARVGSVGYTICHNDMGIYKSHDVDTSQKPAPMNQGQIAQWLEHLVYIQKVLGSIPSLAISLSHPVCHLYIRARSVLCSLSLSPCVRSLWCFYNRECCYNATYEWPLSHRGPRGLPDQCCDSVAMDFIGLLPTDHSFDMILMFTDRSRSNVGLVICCLLYLCLYNAPSELSLFRNSLVRLVLTCRGQKITP